MAKLVILLSSELKGGKLPTTGGTMLLSVVDYAFVHGWRYAAGCVVLLFLPLRGSATVRMVVGVPTFIPFVGAW